MNNRRLCWLFAALCSRAWETRCLDNLLACVHNHLGDSCHSCLPGDESAKKILS
jgi:hypothetical protein